MLIAIDRCRSTRVSGNSRHSSGAELPTHGMGRRMRNSVDRKPETAEKLVRTRAFALTCRRKRLARAVRYLKQNSSDKMSRSVHARPPSSRARPIAPPPPPPSPSPFPLTPSPPFGVPRSLSPRSISLHPRARARARGHRRKTQPPDCISRYDRIISGGKRRLKRLPAARLHRKTGVIPDYNVTAVSRRFAIRFASRQPVRPPPLPPPPPPLLRSPVRFSRTVTVASIMSRKAQFTGLRSMAAAFVLLNENASRFPGRKFRNAAGRDIKIRETQQS